jgi:hypothetical protein
MLMSIRDRFAHMWDSEDLLDSLWHVLASGYVTLFLVASIAVLVCLGLLLPQRPTQALIDPTTNNLWLTSLRDRYDAAADWLIRLGLVDIYRSLWFRGLFGLLAFNLMLGAIHLVRPRLRLIQTADTRVLLGDASAEERGALLQRVEQILREHKFRLVKGLHDGVVYADRFVLYRLLAYLGVLLVIGGLAFSERTSWWEEDFVLRPGQVRPLGHETSLAVHARALNSVIASGGTQGQDAQIELTFFRANSQVGRSVLRGRLPAFFSGLLFWQTSVEPALLVKAQDGAGHDLALQTPETGVTEFREVALRFLEDESQRYIVALGFPASERLGRQFEERGNERYILVPSRNLTLRLTYQPLASDGAAPNFRVEVFRPNELSAFHQHDFDVTSLLEIQGDIFTFEPQSYVILKFGQDHGLVLILLGTALAILGTLLGAWRPLQRMWLATQVINGEVRLLLTPTTVTRHGKLPWFENIVQSVGVALELDAPSEA